MSAAALLRQICRDYEIPQAELARLTGIGPTTLSYYFAEDGFKGQFLPSEKPWAHRMKSVLKDMGVPDTKIASLFGILATDAKIESLEADIEELRRLVVRLASDIESIKSGIKNGGKARRRH